jgi:cytochrome c1
LYLRHCAACHGKDGDGNGVAAAFLFPKPRDFGGSSFRLVSTTNGVPSAEDIHGVLERGMPGSSMPSWAHLSHQEHTLLVDEVRRLRVEGLKKLFIRQWIDDGEDPDDIDQDELQDFVESRSVPSDPSPVPNIAEPTAESIARGKDTYFKLSCHSCHGNEGKGDGQQKMVDTEGFPTSPRDFTLGIFKGNHDPKSVYWRVALGMPGSPMPATSNATEDQMVDLVHFIRSLSDDAAREAAVLRRERIVARSVDAVPPTADDEVWSASEPVTLRMVPLWWRDDANPDLEVQALHDGTTIAVRLSWMDESEDGHAARSQSFEDAVALELYRGDAEPFVGMGDPNSPVDVWFWDADRQGSPTGVEDVYPNTVVDRFPFSEAVVTSAELDRDGARTADQPDISLPARATGNAIVPTDDESGASSLSVGGPGSVTFRIPQSQLVDARGEWRDGRWTVVMTRALAVLSEADGVALQPGGRASVAFAVWDGSQKDRDGKKLITIWQDLELEK